VRIKVRAKQKALATTLDIASPAADRFTCSQKMMRRKKLTNCDGGYAATLISYICFALPVQLRSKSSLFIHARERAKWCRGARMAPPPAELQIKRLLN
jgi:hypothetical protein